MIKPNTLTGKPFIEMDMRASKYFKFGERNTPRAFCSGPSNAANGGVSGYSAAAVPSLHTELGLRFEF